MRTCSGWKRSRSPWGFVDGDDVLELLPVNSADNFLHLGLTLAGLSPERGGPLTYMSREKRTSTTLSLTTGGITLLGVLLSVGVSVGFGVQGAWWVRALAGVGTTVVLILVVKFGTSAGRGPIARLARWTIGSADDPDG